MQILSSLKRYTKDLLVYGLGNILSFLLPVAFLPIFTNILCQEDYGLSASFLALTQIFIVVISVGSVSAVSRGFYEDWDKDEFGSYIFNGLLINAASLLIMLFFVLMLANLFSQDSSWFFITVFAVISGFLITIKDYKHKIWNLEKKSTAYAVFQNCLTFSLYFLTLILILFVFPDWRSRVYGFLIANLLFAILSLIFLLKENKPNISFEIGKIKSLLSFGAPLLLHGLGIALLASADKLLLSSLENLSSVGVLAVATAIAGIMSIPIIAVDLTLNPRIQELLKNHSVQSYLTIRKLSYLTFLTYVMSGIVLYSITPIIFKYFIGSDFQSSKDFVGYLIIGQIFYGMYRFYVRPIFFSKKTLLVTLSTFLSGILSLVIMYFLILSLQATGAAIGTMIGYFVACMMAMVFAKKANPSWKF